MHINAPARSQKPLLRTILSPLTPHSGLSSPSLTGKTVRFQFPSQAARVRDISEDLDKVATTIALLRTKSTQNLSSPRLQDAPISLRRLKPIHRVLSKDDLYARKQTLVLLSGFKPLSRRSNPLLPS